MSTRKWIIIVGFAGIAVLAGCAHRPTHPGVPRLYKVNEGLYRGAKPSGVGWNHLKDIGIQTVIYLEEGETQQAHGRKLAENAGMEFYGMPMSLYERPSDEHVLKFLDIVMDPGKQPVFVHCDSGKDKTGTMIAVYRVVVEGWGPKEGYNEAKKFGFWPYRGDAVLKSYIHQLKDKKIFYERAAALKKGM